MGAARAALGTGLLLGGGLLVALAAVACQSAGVEFVGTAEAPRVPAGDILDLGTTPPDGTRVIGVVTLRCETLDGTAGLLERPCDEETSIRELRRRAAEVGGTGLVDVDCRESWLGSEMGDTDATANTPQSRRKRRAALTCHATVVTGEVHAAAVDTSEHFRVGEVEVDLGGDRPPGPRRDAPIGELEVFPDGYPRLGRVWAICRGGCSRQTARRALQEAAARRGAVAISDVACSLAGERWRCEGTL
ncbi:MAG: hypothetical protein KC731_27800, partial [Myxococcales bacterium]|nr:hypothetical protein [Myxococcales bacterium]